MVELPDQFVFNTFAFLIWGALVMWMCAGFTMLESGAVRTKNASMICLKNIGIYSIAGLAYFFIGYNLMYTDVGNLIGSFDFLYGPSGDEKALLGGDAGAVSAVVENGHATMSGWFFQMVFVATAASIVSGAIAERIKMWSFFAFTLILTAFVYPIVGAWTWGGGWLAEKGFQDFAGSTIVHGTGGWAALAGVLVVGPRLGKFKKDGSVKATPPSNVLVVTFGTWSSARSAVCCAPSASRCWRRPGSTMSSAPSPPTSSPASGEPWRSPSPRAADSTFSCWASCPSEPLCSSCPS